MTVRYRFARSLKNSSRIFSNPCATNFESIIRAAKKCLGWIQRNKENIFHLFDPQTFSNLDGKGRRNLYFAPREIPPLPPLLFPKGNNFVAETAGLKATAAHTRTRGIEGRFRNDNWHEGERSRSLFAAPSDQNFVDQGRNLICKFS